MILLLDIGNTNTHIGLANNRRVVRQSDISTASWQGGNAKPLLRRFVRTARLEGVAVCSVVPRVVSEVRRVVAEVWSLPCLCLTPERVWRLGIDYPKPKKIGTDRLANALAAKTHFGAPVLVVDFGTAVTFDVVDARGKYVGGIIAPGLAAMTDYLHEKTALLPRIKIHDEVSAIGKSTAQAMRVGAVHGYRGLVRELIGELKRELKARRLPVVATGGYAELMARNVREITAVNPQLTLEGLRLMWEDNHPRRAHN